MTVLDTNFMIYLLRNKAAAEEADYYSNPKTTTITLLNFIMEQIVLQNERKASKISIHY